MPTNRLLLKAKIIEKGYNQISIAEELGISYQSLSRKMNNKTAFKVSEIVKLCDLLGIENKDDYFFYRVNSQNG